jgi:hypothetical protein
MEETMPGFESEEEFNDQEEDAYQPEVPNTMLFGTISHGVFDSIGSRVNNYLNFCCIFLVCLTFIRSRRIRGLLIIIISLLRIWIMCTSKWVATEAKWLIPLVGSQIELISSQHICYVANYRIGYIVSLADKNYAFVGHNAKCEQFKIDKIIDQ